MIPEPYVMAVLIIACVLILFNTNAEDQWKDTHNDDYDD